MKEIKFYKSRWRAIKILLLCSIFVVGGILMIISEDNIDWKMWVCVGFFSLGYPVALFHLFDRRPQIIINEIGIYDRTTKQDFINWEYIVDAYLGDVNGQKFISLILNEDFVFKNKGKLHKSMVALNRTLGFQEINISLGQIKVNEMELMELVIAMSQADKKEKELLINRYRFYNTVNLTKQ